MLRAAVAVVACLCLARSSPAESHALRTYAQNPHSIKELGAVLTSINERLRVLDTITALQAKQSRRLDVIQDKLDRVETTISLRLERAQLAADRLEHRLHMLQTNVQASIKDSNDRIQRSQLKVAELAQNLTHDIVEHRRILEKVNGAYTDTWRRGLLLENMMRDGLSLVNATRRELADGLRGLARRQRDSRLNSAELDASFTKRLNDNTYMIDLKLQEVLDAQKRFLDSCQRVQQDDPSHVADVLDKLIDSLINKTAATFKELQTIQAGVRNHDARVMKHLTMRPTQAETSCRRLETAFKNMSQSAFKETELHQLTEKFVELTNRADSALQRLEAKMAAFAAVGDEESEPSSDVAAEADRLMLKLKGIKNEYDSEEDAGWEDFNPKYPNGYYDDDDEIDSDLMGKDRQLLSGARRGRQVQPESKTSTSPRPTTPARVPHRRHLHKHPYDRGPKHVGTTKLP